MAEEKKYPDRKPSKHATIRIPKEMAESLDEFLKTDYARKLGFLYKIDIVTAAIREFLLSLGWFRMEALKHKVSDE